MLPLIILAGPTTSNKSDTAIELAEKINSEIISADSMQVYKYFNIGTAKVTPADRVRIPHHLIDILEPDQEFSAFDFKTRALAHTRELHSQGKVPIITGGTGLYIKALCEGYDCAVQINPEIKKQVQSDIQTKGLPEMHRELLQIDPNSAERIPPLDRQRIERAISVYRQTGAPFSKFSKENSKTNYEFPIHTFLIERDRKELYANINQRVEKMIEKGWIEEVKNLLAQGFSEKLKPFQSIGYAQIIKFLHEKQSLEKTIDLIKQDTRNYAKRQITWFKKLYDAKTINAESSDNPITLRDKILALIPQTLGLFAFFISLSFANPENVMGSEIRPYSSGLSQFQKGNFHQAALLFRSIHSSSSDSRAKKRASYLLAHSLAHTNKLDESIKLFLASIKSYPEIEDYIRFHLAEVFLNSGKTKEALEQVNTLHKNFPNTLLLTKSNILLAKILEKDNKIQAALNVLGEAEKRISGFSMPSEYRSYLPEVIFLQGHLYQKLGKKNEAYDRYRLLHIVAPTNQLTQQAKGEVIKLAKDMAIGIKSLALNEYEQRTRALLHDVEYQQIVSEVSELLKHNTSLPANFYFYLAKAQKGLRKRNLSNSALRKFLEHHPNHRRKQEALFMIGRNLWNTGYYRDGLEYFKNSIDTATNHTLANQARFFIGKMHEEKKRYPKATKYYTELISKSSDEYAERAAWQLGWMNYTIGNFKKAYDYFDNSVRKYPSGLFIESSMFWSAKSAKQLKRMGLAQQIFANVNMRFPYTYYGIRAGEMKSDKKLFKDIKTSKFAGKITPEVSGQIFLPRETTPIKDKTKHFILVATRSNSLNVRKNPSSSSPVVARLLKGSKVPHIKNNTPENRDGSWFYIEYSKGKFGWVSSSYTKEITDSGSRITQQPNLKTLKPKKVHTSETPRTSELRELKSPEIPREQEPPFATPILSTDAHFHHSRGVELSAIGFYEDARLEIKKLESTIRKNLPGVLWLTKLYNDAHAYSDTMRVMQLYKDFKTKLLEKDLTKNFWENFYPLAYAKAIRDNAKIFNIDPYFVKGLIRQESLFNSQVQSRAGAIGLMQIMPETGRVLYANSTKSEPFNTTILFNPETNIQLGIQYIGQLNKRFKKNKTHILISYNAGPHNLKKWLKRFSHLQDPDVFIESIPYPETRKYVKKVLRNYGIYQSLYSKKNL